jgi:serine/threonine protein kinase
VLAGPSPTATVVGTPGFMPPEQADGRAAAADERSDVWSLGALLVAMLTGRPPADGPGSARLPRGLAAVCAKALAPDPAARYPTAGALREDLERFRNGEAVTARKDTPLERAGRFLRRHAIAATLIAAYLLTRVVLAFWIRR